MHGDWKLVDSSTVERGLARAPAIAHVASAIIAPVYVSPSAPGLMTLVHQGRVRQGF